MKRFIFILYLLLPSIVYASNTLSYKGVEVTPVNNGLVFGYDSALFKGSYNDLLNIKYLTYVMYCESRSDGLAGMSMTLNVIINRMRHKKFPNTIRDVVFQPKAFSCFNKSKFPKVTVVGAKEKYLLSWALKKAYDYVMEGKYTVMTKYGIYYHTKNVKPYWSKVYPRLGVIGQHIVYAEIN